jgi:hypothetical protein
MPVKKPIPKSQRELSNNLRESYTVDGISTFDGKVNRGEQRSVKTDNVKKFSIGLRDIDETIVYYFNNVIRPSVIQNGTRKNVPIIYGSPERWAAVQKDGFYRDKNGKIQAPLIMYKRDSIEKNRDLGNKMDANNPINYGIFKKKFSNKNVYDRFNIVNNREPVDEYYGVIIPDYVNITYSCIVFTDYIEQMNKIVESINFASDAYWGNPEKFSFRAMIDNYTTMTELNQGQDRKVKTEFSINMLGHIVPDAINTQLNGQNKFYSTSRVNFKFETETDMATLNKRAETQEREVGFRFFDTSLTGAQQSADVGMTAEQIAYVQLSNVVLADSQAGTVATYTGRQFANPPAGFTLNQYDFQVYVNGVILAFNDRTVAEVGSNIQVTITGLGYNLDDDDKVLLIGKFI